MATCVIECVTSIVFEADVADPENLTANDIDHDVFKEAVYYQIIKANPVEDLNATVIEITEE
jgi:hypothetical protein